MQLEQRQLFGGAITINLPKDDLIDASSLREVPDTQEVFLHKDSTVSWVIEILQRVEPEDPLQAGRFHFDSLAHDNDALKSEIVSVVALESAASSSTPSPVICTGWQEVTKYNRRAADKVEIILAVYRLPAQNTDLVLSVNIPLVLADGTSTPPALVEGIRSSFETIARSLNVADFGLFA